MQKTSIKQTAVIALIGSTLLLQGCVHKLVTVPAKVAYKTTKGVVKAVIPNGDKEDKKDKKKQKENKQD